MLDQRNTKKQGNVGLGSAIAYYTSMGFVVSIPLTDDQSYDLIVDDGEFLKKIQVKTTRYVCRGKYQVLLKTAGWSKGTRIRHFDKNCINELFVLTNDGAKYRIPSKEIVAKTTLNLTKKYDGWKV